MGQSLISYKGDGWRGRTTLSTNERGDRRLVRILNGYVNADGSEIRSFPGWRTLLDLSDENNPDGGYSRYVIDAMRPVMDDVSPNQFYVDEYLGGTSAMQTLYARAKPIWFEAFEQVGDTLNIIGTTRFREVPIYDSNRDPIVVEFIRTEPSGAGRKFVFDLVTFAVGHSARDADGPGLNGLAQGEVVYCEGFTVEGDSTLQSALDAKINGRVHVVENLIGSGSFTIRLFTDIGIDRLSQVAVTGGSIHKVRPNRSDVYPTPTGADPFDSDSDDRIDDWNALTNWRIIPTLSLSMQNATSHVCHPAWVANRQRDFSDEQGDYTPASLATGFVEGIGTGQVPGSAVFARGVSKREQRELPYRIVPEPAGDRIILAAPGYNCLFQIPLMVPMNPDQWPLAPADTTLGVPWFGNDIYDKPRALGVPKCRLVDTPFDTPPPSPDQGSSTGNFSHLVQAMDVSPTFGFPPGTYKLCATYQDDITGEEGEPSEVIEVTVPANTFAYVIKLRYFHPGYIMPECLALRINVYMSAPDGEALGFYKSFDLKSESAHADSYLGFSYDNTSGDHRGDLSAKYGFLTDASPDAFNRNAEWRTLVLPIPLRALESSPGVGDFDLGINFFRPPVTTGMPRGASCARYIRGVLIAGGHIGISGPNRVLYEQRGTIILDINADGVNFAKDEILIAIHGNNDFLNFSDGGQEDGFGVAGRAFPDSCQGIEAISQDLVPRNFGRFFQIDKILNRRMKGTDSQGFVDAARERLKTVYGVVDTDYATSPADAEFVPVIRDNRTYYLRMFKGQLQIGDPGQPEKVVKAAGIGIKITDPNKDDDIYAIFQMAGNAIVCTRKETFFFSWARSAGGEEPTVVNTEFGCIAPSSMVEFDGGVAWLSERGPVALGASLQFVGGDVQQDFVGANKRYATDSEGMMRHSWACHDSARGIVMWGLVTDGATHLVNDGRGNMTTQQSANDSVLSRIACDEVLIWSYRSNSFSTWRPPEGLEVLWMRQIVIRSETNASGSEMVIAFLANDGRIYVLDDSWSDCNESCLTTTAVGKATNSDALTLVRSVEKPWASDGVANGGPLARTGAIDGSKNCGFLMRVGHVVQAIDSNNGIAWSSTIASIDQDNDTINLTSAQSWVDGQTIRVGARPEMVIETAYAGGNTSTIECKTIQMRYTLEGNGVTAGRANAKVEALGCDLNTDGDPKAILFRPASVDLGVTSTTPPTATQQIGGRYGRRRQIGGDITAPEIAVRLTVSSEPQVRIADIMLEV